MLAPMRRRAFVGSAERVADQLQALATELQLDELVINTWTCDPAVRRRSYALLAQAVGIAA
jgi:alkanesulfonate monooxygenase SsuD/methylene tetrahydromethanopterin reductase-like flavin-dependent oxidoreductase (luciferase family)